MITGRELIDCVRGMTIEERGVLSELFTGLFVGARPVAPNAASKKYPPTGLEVNQMTMMSMTDEERAESDRRCLT